MKNDSKIETFDGTYPSDIQLEYPIHAEGEQIYRLQKSYPFNEMILNFAFDFFNQLPDGYKLNLIDIGGAFLGVAIKLFTSDDFKEYLPYLSLANNPDEWSFYFEHDHIDHDLIIFKGCF